MTGNTQSKNMVAEIGMCLSWTDLYSRYNEEISLILNIDWKYIIVSNKRNVNETAWYLNILKTSSKMLPYITSTHCAMGAISVDNVLYTRKQNPV